MAGRRPPPPKLPPPTAEPAPPTATSAPDDAIEWIDEAVVRDFATSPPTTAATTEPPATSEPPAIGEPTTSESPAVEAIAAEPAPAPAIDAPAEPPVTASAPPPVAAAPSAAPDRTKLWIGGAAAVVALALIWRCGSAGDPGETRPPIAAAPTGDRAAAKFDAPGDTPSDPAVIAGGARANDGAAAGSESARGAGADPAQPAAAERSAAADPSQPTAADPSQPDAAEASASAKPDDTSARTDSIAASSAAPPAADKPASSSGRTTPIGSSSARADDTRKLSAEELLTRARQAWKDGNARDTFKYANQSRYKQPSSEATELSTLAACKMHQTDTARSSFDDLDGDRRRRVRTACRDMGVRVGL